jgi:uncharacterized OsmC-like protein
MKKLGITSAKVHVEMDYWLRGSVLQGTVVSGWNEVRTHFDIESDESEEAVLEVIRLAKAGCYAERLVETAVPLHSTATLNGKHVELPSEGN